MAPHDRMFAEVAKARELARSDSEDDLRYAALHARLAIEKLFYEFIGLHRDELPTDVYEKWQPRQVIDALTDCDPGIVKDRSVRIGNEVEPGVPASEYYLEVKQKALSRKLLRDHYHRLGSFLHADMRFAKLDCQKLREAVERACEDLEVYREASALFNVGKHVEFVCDCCGEPNKRNQASLVKNPEIRCRNSECGAIYDCESAGPDEWSLALRSSTVGCECGHATLVGRHLLKDGFRFRCENCAQLNELKAGFLLARVPENGEDNEA